LQRRLRTEKHILLKKLLFHAALSVKAHSRALARRRSTARAAQRNKPEAAGL